MMLCKERPSHLTIPHCFPGKVVSEGHYFLRYKKFRAEKLNNYCRLLLLMVLFDVYNRKLKHLFIFIVCDNIQV
jgi:hypothetical protein